eukprot:3011836-Pleurochrysis_carterae.AAC.1
MRLGHQNVGDARALERPRRTARAPTFAAPRARRAAGTTRAAPTGARDERPAARGPRRPRWRPRRRSRGRWCRRWCRRQAPRSRRRNRQPA